VCEGSTSLQACGGEGRGQRVVEKCLGDRLEEQADGSIYISGRGPGCRAGLLDHHRVLCVRQCGERKQKAFNQGKRHQRQGNQIYGGVCMERKEGMFWSLLLWTMEGPGWALGPVVPRASARAAGPGYGAPARWMGRAWGRGQRGMGSGL